MACACGTLKNGAEYVCDSCRKYERRVETLQRLNDIALGSQHKPYLFANAVWQEFKVDLPRKTWFDHVDYDIQKCFNFEWIVSQIVDAKWNVLDEMNKNGTR